MNNYTDSDSLSATCTRRRRATCPMYTVLRIDEQTNFKHGRQHSPSCQPKDQMRFQASKIISYSGPASGVATVTLLAGSRNPTGARSHGSLAFLYIDQA